MKFKSKVFLIIILIMNILFLINTKSYSYEDNIYYHYTKGVMDKDIDFGAKGRNSSQILWCRQKGGHLTRYDGYIKYVKKGPTKKMPELLACWLYLLEHDNVTIDGNTYNYKYKRQAGDTQSDIQTVIWN